MIPKKIMKLINKMTVAFTICANNYLAHAKTLAVSFNLVEYFTQKI